MHRWAKVHLTSVALVLAAAMAGCGGDDDGGGGAPPVALENFCAEFTDALCDRVERCDCGPLASICRTQLAEQCGGARGFLGPTVRASIDAGAIRYDAAAAGRTLAALRADSTCDLPIAALRWTVRDVLTFGGTLNGTKAPGQSCTVSPSRDSPFGSECANGVCFGDEGGSMGRCIGLGGVGAMCGFDTPTPALCIDPDARVLALEDESFLLRCDGATMRCAARLPVGMACESDVDCESQYCSRADGATTGTCAPKLADGMPCTYRGACMSGFCDFGGASPVCAPRRALGQSCTDSSACVSGACRGGKCVAGACGVVDADFGR